MWSITADLHRKQITQNSSPHICLWGKFSGVPWPTTLSGFVPLYYSQRYFQNNQSTETLLPPLSHLLRSSFEPPSQILQGSKMLSSGSTVYKTWSPCNAGKPIYYILLHSVNWLSPTSCMAHHWKKWQLCKYGSCANYQSSGIDPNIYYYVYLKPSNEN